ncbi:dihydrofolate reductase [Carboxylicivirga sp. A043]|uniref:NAD(P)-dependent oxidoreductase n=1 Tax=Carboxylicivirga litoralis TaxID=2816963 RepID=UPI0021CB10FA|nr:NAD(P)-dependent oxidoreductase [Carboxylicivirga sp. A043]MCU4155784.1 dihydrofolate reductase [Carboxylicivirga sp. A043]
MFTQLVILDYTGLQGFAIEKLQALSDKPIKVYNTIPATDEEKIKRIGNADGLFVSWNTPVNAKVIERCKHLKYIGMCCSLIDEDSANVDVRYACSKGIEVRGVRDYGDEGVAEFIVSELIQLLKGLGKHQWLSEPVELTKRKIGIIGLGTTGLMTAQRLQAFGSKIYYYSRTRKYEAEKCDINYLPISELISECDIISFHLPRKTKVLTNEHFEILGTSKILVNTSLGLPFDIGPFEKWLLKTNNYAIFDLVAFGSHKEQLIKNNNLIYAENTSGWTREAKERLSYKVIENVSAYLHSKND